MKMRNPNRKTQRCTCCHRRKKLDAFRIRSNNGQLDSWCIKCWDAYHKTYRLHYLEKQGKILRGYDKYRALQLKLETIAAYGGKCSCCGEDTPEFLTVDCKRHNSGFHKQVRYGGHFYRWLKKHKYPKRQFQLLCFNCNCAKGLFGKCPHKRKHK